MTRFLIVGLAAIAAVLGGAYAATVYETTKQSASETIAVEPVEIMKLEPISVPVIRQGVVEGYVIARVAVTAASSEVKKSRADFMLYAGAASFRAVYEEEALDFTALKLVQLASLSERITKLANAEIGRPSIKKTVIETLNFVKRSEVR